MLLLATSYFSVKDLAVFPICFILLFFIIRARAKRNKEGAMQVYDLGLGVKKYSTVYSSILS